MLDAELHEESALREANTALSRRKHHELTRVRALELRSLDPSHGPWEAVAMISIAVLAVLVTLGLWLL